MYNILIIEDEERVSEVLKAYLEKEGYKAYCTTRGLEGIEMFKTMNFKLIILDLMLPDLTGEEVCKIIRQISDVHIKNIRKKIEQDTKKPKYIITVMKVGYKFGGEN